MLPPYVGHYFELFELFAVWREEKNALAAFALRSECLRCFNVGKNIITSILNGVYLLPFLCFYISVAPTLSFVMGHFFQQFYFPTQSRCQMHEIFTLLNMMRFQTCEHAVSPSLIFDISNRYTMNLTNVGWFDISRKYQTEPNRKWKPHEKKYSYREKLYVFIQFSVLNFNNASTIRAPVSFRKCVSYSISSDGLCNEIKKAYSSACDSHLLSFIVPLFIARL